ncbi:Blue-light-activated protein [compost metagenome]
MDIVDYLAADGFEVFEAPNAADAIVLLEANPHIQILFTDIDMPGSMDGLMLAAAVRDRWPPIKIVVTSGHWQMNDKDLPVEGQFIRKPYQPQTISSAFREIGVR